MKASEISNQPWINDWAKWRTLGYNGILSECENKPEEVGDYWMHSGRVSVIRRDVQMDIPWQECIWQRPEKE